MDSKHLHSTDNSIESFICTDDILALGEKFNDVLSLSKNIGNLVERSTDNTYIYDVLVPRKKFGDNSFLILSEK